MRQKSETIIFGPFCPGLGCSKGGQHYPRNNQQLFFEIEVNSGRIFTEPRSGEVNILPLFIEIEKNNGFSIYSRSDLNNICRRKPSKVDLIDISIHAWKTCKRHKACAKVFTEASNMAKITFVKILVTNSGTFHL